MCAEFPDEAVIFSCDSKAKIHIGGQGVARIFLKGVSNASIELHKAGV